MLAGDIPCRSKPVDLQLPAIRVYGIKFLLAEFQALLLFALSRAPRAFALLGEYLGRVDNIDGALLKLDRIAPRCLGLIDELFGDIEIVRNKENMIPKESGEK